MPQRASASPVVPSTTAPTAADLLDFVRRTAADDELIDSLPLDPEGRTWVRLDGPGGSEAWLIGWPPGTGTGWHDHAESHGAFTTARGVLRENSLATRLPSGGWKTLELADGVDRERRQGAGVRTAPCARGAERVLRHARRVGPRVLSTAPLIRRFSRSGAVLRLEQVERPEDWQ